VLPDSLTDDTKKESENIKKQTKMKTVTLLFLVGACPATAFAPQKAKAVVPKMMPVQEVEPSFAPEMSTSDHDGLMKRVAAGVLPFLASAPAVAAGPDWGLFEGKTGSLLHPVMMASLFVYSCYTAYLGFQWRRQRTMGAEISDLQKQLPISSLSGIEEEMTKMKNGEESQFTLSQLQAAIPLAQQVADLQAERKELSQKGPKDQHFAQGALLAFLGTAFAIEGPLNTYARAGKLFPGPHLYAGAGLVVIWALAVATIPAMQKGNDTARTVHIGANIAGIAMFAWQIQSGIPILLKVWEKTSWP